MRFVLLLTLLASCTDPLPNEPFDAPGEASAGRDAELGERAANSPLRLTFRGSMAADGTALIEIRELTLERLPIIQGWQEKEPGVWANDVVSRVVGPSTVEVKGTPAANYQLVVMP